MAEKIRIKDTNSCIKGTISIEGEHIEFEVNVEALCKALNLPPDRIRDTILKGVKKYGGIRIVGWKTPHYAIEGENVVLYLRRDQKKAYPLIKNLSFRMVDYKQNAVIAQLKALAKEAIKFQFEKRARIRKEIVRFRGELAEIRDKLSEDMGAALSHYKLWLKRSLVRGGLTIREFKFMYNLVNQDLKEDTLRSLLALLLYEVGKE